MNRARVLGIAGWSGSGKTTLIVRLIPLLLERGLSIATIKHADASFDVDQPGKDSYQHRHAGAGEVIVSSARRWVQMHEVGAGAEATLAQLLARLSPCDLVLVEGYKRGRQPKLEVLRRGVGARPLYLSDARIVAVASDAPQPHATIPVVQLDDLGAIADLVQARAEPLQAVVDGLADSGGRR